MTCPFYLFRAKDVPFQRQVHIFVSEKELANITSSIYILNYEISYNSQRSDSMLLKERRRCAQLTIDRHHFVTRKRVYEYILV